MSHKYKFTVFTAATRKGTIHRVYESLSKQTFSDFEWLIVSDGGEEGLTDEVNKFISVGNIPIVYIEKENGGKHTAYNRALKAARGELFLPLDDDDACTNDALEIFNSEWKKIKDDQSFLGICCDCIDQNGNLVGNSAPEDFIDATAFDLRTKHNIQGEKWGFGRTDVVRNYLFPEPEGVKFVMEAVIQEQYAHQYKLRYITKALRVYHVPDLAGQGDNLSYLTPRTAIGMAFSYMYALNNGIRLRSTVKKNFGLVDMAKFYVNCWRFNLITGKSFSEIISEVSTAKNRAVMILYYPLGVVLFRKTASIYPEVYRDLKKI